MTVNHDVVGSSPTAGVVYDQKSCLNKISFIMCSLSVWVCEAEDKYLPLCGCVSKVIPKELQTPYNNGAQAYRKVKGEKYDTKGTQFITQSGIVKLVTLSSLFFMVLV